MGIYAVTGGTKGIGGQTVQILRSQGHEVINIDIDGGDIAADLGTDEGRGQIIAEIRARCPEGLDGLACVAGIAPIPRFTASYILSVNFFGTVRVAEGLYDLLKMKRGFCAVTLTCTSSFAYRGKYTVDSLLLNCGDEARIGRLVDSFELLPALNAMYLSSKMGLARWVRRISATWAAHGVNINAVAPGAVDTTIMHDYRKPEDGLFDYPMPTLFGQQRTMDPSDVAEALAFLVSPGARGISGAILSCDAGTAAVHGSERIW